MRTPNFRQVVLLLAAIAHLRDLDAVVVIVAVARVPPHEDIPHVAAGDRVPVESNRSKPNRKHKTRAAESIEH